MNFIYLIFVFFIIFISIVLFYNYYNYNNYNNYNKVPLKNNIDNNIIKNEKKLLNDDIISNINNEGFVNELIKNIINYDNSEYKNQFLEIKSKIPTNNIIGFNTPAKEEKKDLPYANINVNYLSKIN